MIRENVEVRMPDFSELSDDLPYVSKWFIKVGDSVKIGDVIAEVELPTCSVELEAYIEGEILHIATKEKIALKADDLLYIIGEKQLEKSTIEVRNTESNVESESDKEIPDVEIITMPRMSKKMTYGIIRNWKFRLGEFIKEGEVLMEIDTDKATMELEAYRSGFILHKGAEKGDSVEIGKTIAVIGKKGEEFENLIDDHEQITKFLDSKNHPLPDKNTNNKKSGFLNRLWDFLTP